MLRSILEWRRLVLAGGVLLPLWCAAGTGKPRSLYDGAEVWFEQAQLLKPRETTNHSRAWTLAPLIIQEVAPPNTSPPDAGQGRTGAAPDLVPTRVHFQPGSVTLNGRSHAQMTYAWHYPSTSAQVRPPPAPRRPDVRQLQRVGLASDTPMLGVRLTLSSNGVPVIYEVFDTRRGSRQVFVTQSIEAAARAEHGPALPGRRHAVEPGLSDAPEVVVPRVLEDPPDIMGPILYLEAGTRAVATVICRCMNAQAKELVGQGFYELVPADISGTLSRATRLDAANPRGLREDFSNQSDRLSRSQRLPRDF
jgi:hypothetical protein